MAKGIHKGRKAKFQAKVFAVYRCIRFTVNVGLFVFRSPARHGHKRRRETFPLQVAGKCFITSGKDAVDVAGCTIQSRKPRAAYRRNMPADIIPAALLVASPHHRVSLGPGPSADRPDETPGIAVVFYSFVSCPASVDSEFIPLANPGYVKLA